MTLNVGGKDGKWIECPGGKFVGFARYIRLKTRDALESLPEVKPNGFHAFGKFYF